MSRIHNSGYNTRERPDLVCNPTRNRIPLHTVADHDILGWIRIRGIMPLTNGSGSLYIRHQTSRRQKTNLKKSFSVYYLFLTKTIRIRRIRNTLLIMLRETKQQKHPVLKQCLQQITEYSGLHWSPGLPDPDGKSMTRILNYCSVVEPEPEP